MRDAFLSVAEPGACPSVSLLRALKREFGFYCIELSAEQPFESEMAYAMGGYAYDPDVTQASMEQYDPLTNRWSAVDAMGTARCAFGACAVAENIV